MNRNPDLAAGKTLDQLVFSDRHSGADDGTAARITSLNEIIDFQTFGGTQDQMGDCEGNPHGVIHNDTGLQTGELHDMGNLGYAAQDPIFFAHHCNIDKIWSRWNALSNGGGLPPGAYQNPTDPAFLNNRWTFYDENKNAVSISAADVLDHVRNLRYTYEPSFVVPKPLLVFLPCLLFYNPPDPGPTLQVSEQVRVSVLNAAKQGSPVSLVLANIPVTGNVTGTFDIFSMRADRRFSLGSLAIVSSTKGHSDNVRVTLSLDVTKAIEDLLAISHPAFIVTTRRGEGSSFTLPSMDGQLRTSKLK